MRLFIVAVFLLFAPAWLENVNAEPKRALPVDPAQTVSPSAAVDSTNALPAPATLPLAVPGGINIHWYGHGFIYITSSVGVRAAIDPYGPNTVHYPFPPHLTADFILITHEAEDHASADQVFGDPLIFRSVTAVGLNRANGIEFHGVSLQRDPDGKGGANTSFLLSFDGITMCYLGQVSAPLLPQEQQQLGHSDVVFLPVGLQTVTVPQLNQMAISLGAKIIIPINYKTDKSGDLPLRPLDDYLAGAHLPVRRFDTPEIALTRAALPEQPTIYLLKSP